VPSFKVIHQQTSNQHMLSQKQADITSK